MNSVCPSCDKTIVDECEKCGECGQITCMGCVSDDPSYFSPTSEEDVSDMMMCRACWETIL